MDTESPEVSKLFESFRVLKEEFEIVIYSFVFWEHLFKERHGKSNVHAIMRTIYFRETVLGITRIWDDSSRNKSSLSMFRIEKYMCDKRIIDFLSEKGMNETSLLLNKVDAIKDLLSKSRQNSIQNDIEKNIQSKAQNIIQIVSLYKGGSNNDLTELKNIRDNVIAHRNIKSQPNSIVSTEIVRRIYTHTSSIVENLVEVLGYERWDIQKIEDLYRSQLLEWKL